MSLQRFTRRSLISATTTRPWTTNFRHLLPIPKQWLKRASPRDAMIKSVRPIDRIKYWNIVPGDQIRILGDKSNTIHEVLSINRISNRVFVKGAVNSGEEDTNKVVSNKNYHYSRCQLFLGNYEFASPSGTKVQPVFAQRLGSSMPYWNPFFHQYEWKRFASCTTPRLPAAQGQQTPIPWPVTQPKKNPDPSQYDTPKEEVMKVTYKPPAFSPSLRGLIPRPPLEKDFLASMYNTHRRSKIDESMPAEIFLHRELSNPHATAKKLKRWKIHQHMKQALLKQITDEDIKNANGKPLREVKAEAAFKWRQQLAEEKEAQRKRRWKHAAAEAEMMRKKARQGKKEARLRQRLTELVLKEEPNQVIPKEL